MPCATVRAWSPERDAALAQLWADGSLSAAEIGRRLGTSKNSVVGRSHRLHLPARQSPIRRGDSPKIRQPRTKRSTLLLEELAPGREPVTPAPQTPNPISAVERLRGPCRWPIGHPGTPGFAFCGAVSRPGRPYCEEHCECAYVRRATVCTDDARPRRGQHHQSRQDCSRSRATSAPHAAA